MIVDDLTKGLRNKIAEIFSIKNSLTVMNVPKQSLLEKGDIIILLSEKNKPIIVEFIKTGKYHLELKNASFPKLLVENILGSKSIKLFETEDFDSEYDTDYYINYSDLDINDRRNFRTFIKNAEKKLYNDHVRFGKLSNESLKKTISVQNGLFTVWMKENGFDIPDKKCLKEAYNEALKHNDMQLKKRAVAAKCYHKVYLEKLNGSK